MNIGQAQHISGERWLFTFYLKKRNPVHLRYMRQPMPSVPVHANNSCLAASVEKRRNEINNMQASTERSILPILLDSLKANIINVKDSATTISLICILSVCTHQHYIRIRHTPLQEAGVHGLIDNLQPIFFLINFEERRRKTSKDNYTPYKVEGRKTSWHSQRP